MRIGDYTVKPTNKDHADFYESQNNQLKKLHEERMQRQRQKNKDIVQNITSPKQSYLVKVLKPVQKKQKEVLCEPYQKIFLNALLTDHRDIKQKINFVTISSFFQQSPRSFGMGISKKINCVLISTYGFQMEILAPIAESGVPFYIINDSQEQGTGRVQKGYQAYPNVTLVIPPRKNKGYGVFHSKVWLIKFDTFLRVVIGTGNQHVNDWAVWLNAYWYQDFPLKQESQQKTQQKQTIKQKANRQNLKQNPNTISLDDSDEEIKIQNKIKQPKKVQNKKQQTKKQPEEDQTFSFQRDFVQTLFTVLQNMFPSDYSFEKEVGIDLKKYDFSKVKVILIPSIMGRHYAKDNQMNKFGIAKVKNIIAKVGPKIRNGTLTYSSSSLGVVQQNIVRQIYSSFLPSAEYFTPNNFRLIYPSLKYIQQETGGQAQVLFLKNQNYHRSSLKKSVFYHYQKSPQNPISGAIPHLKTIIVEDSDKTNKNCIFYMGSHNMTKSAWGTYQKNDTQINFSNAQLGLLFLEYDKEYLLSWLPYKYPPRKYLDHQKPFLRFE